MTTIRHNPVFCWESGPLASDGCPTTCMLRDGHEGDHAFARDDQFICREVATGEEITPTQIKRRLDEYERRKAADDRA